MSDFIRFIPDLSTQILNVVSILNEQHNWGLPYIDIEDAWKHSKGENVKVAIIDTGWCAHKDLTINFLEGYDATGENDPLDHGNYHSVHVAGIIAANCEDRMGVMGVAPNAKIITIKALNNEGTGSFGYICEALKIAKTLDVDIINMSLGTSQEPNNTDMHNLLIELTKQNKIIVCAAGNDAGAVNYPAKYDETIAVAAATKDGKLAKFSSRGPELDVAAPGVQIYSTWGSDQYINLDGTSMACPCITGMIALIISWFKNTGKLDQINHANILKILQELGGDEGKHIVDVGNYDIGVPNFCNFTDWDTNNA